MQVPTQEEQSVYSGNDSVVCALPPALSWTHVRDGLPACDGERVFVGVNSAGFVAAFNAIVMGERDVDCFYETPEEPINVMDCLAYWAPLTLPIRPADNAVQPPNGNESPKDQL